MTVKARSKWNDSEVRFVRTHYGTMTARDIAKRMGRSHSAVKNFIKYHGITPRRERCHWTESEIAYLRSYYGSKPTRDIVKKLRRSYAAVRHKASQLGIVTELRDSIDGRTAETWAKTLGVSQSAVNEWARRGVLQLDEDFDEPYLRTRIISEDTMETWLRQGGAVRCKPHANTPHYWATIIAETKAHYVSTAELTAIDPFFSGFNLRRVSVHMGMAPLHYITVGAGHGHDNYYKKADIYDAIYCVGHIAPRHVKDPYVKAVIHAWESVYVATWELVTLYRPRYRLGHPHHVIRGVYNRAEVVAWLKTQPNLAHHAQALRQDPVCYRDLHRDLDRKVRLGIKI